MRPGTTRLFNKVYLYNHIQPAFKMCEKINVKSEKIGTCLKYLFKVIASWEKNFTAVI